MLVSFWLIRTLFLKTQLLVGGGVKKHREQNVVYIYAWMYAFLNYFFSIYQFSSIAQVMSNSLQHHGLHGRLPCPSPTSGSFLMSQFFASSGQSIGASPSASVLPMNIQDWFSLGLTTLISLQSRLTQEKTLMLGKMEARRRRGQQKTRWLDGIMTQETYEFEQTPGASEGQGSLVCGRSWGRKESDTT